MKFYLLKHETSAFQFGDKIYIKIWGMSGDSPWMQVESILTPTGREVIEATEKDLRYFIQMIFHVKFIGDMREHQ